MEIEMAVFLFLCSWLEAWPLPCIRCSLIGFSVFRVWVFNPSLLLLTFPNISFASCRLRSCHPAALQSIPRRAQCERKQLPNEFRHLQLGSARHSSGLGSTASPMARRDR